MTATTVIMIALGIGASTAIISAINAILLRALPVDAPQELVLLHWSANKLPKFTSYANYGDTKRIALRKASNPQGESFSFQFLKDVEGAGIFSGLAAFADGGVLTLTHNDSATPIESQIVNGTFFQTLGIRPVIGRVFDTRDDDESSPAVIVLSYACWQRMFDGSLLVLGKSVNLNGKAFTIVGVADKKFTGMSVGHVYDAWVPLVASAQLDPSLGAQQRDPAASWLLIAARLKPAQSSDQQQAAVDVLFRNSILYGPRPLLQAHDAPRLTLISAQHALIGTSEQFADPLLVLMAAVGMLLLLACANVAGLLLARGTARTREVAIRLALGTPRARLFLQTLVESLMVAAMGGALGCGLAYWGAHVLVNQLSSNGTHSLGVDVSLDWRMIAITGGLSLVTGLLFGTLPAVQNMRVSLVSALKRGKGPASRGEIRNRWYSVGNILVILQATLAVIVMMGAGLLVHTLTNLRSLDLGFDPVNVLTFGLDPTQAGYKGVQIDNLYRALSEEIASTPGVIAVSFSQEPLLSGHWIRTTIKNPSSSSQANPGVQVNVMPVGPGFFEAMRLPLTAGRSINESDIEGLAQSSSLTLEEKPSIAGSPSSSAKPVPVVINETLAQRFFPNGNVLDLRFGDRNGTDATSVKSTPGYVVVGVARDAKYDSLRSESEPTIYTPLSGQPVSFDVRTASDPERMIPVIGRLIFRHQSNLPMIHVRTEAQQIDRLLEQEKLLAGLSSIFGLLCLSLSCIGLYGLLSYEVNRRTSEIGTRMALGATKSDIFLMVAKQGGVLVAVGGFVGLVVSFVTGRLLRSILYDVHLVDIATLLAVTSLMTIVATVATIIPARLATQMDPCVALRRE